MTKEMGLTPGKESTSERIREREKENQERYTYRHKAGENEIYAGSLKRLSAGQYLNDEIIQFYLSYLLNEKCDKDVRPKIHVFDTIFYGKIKETFSNDIDLKKWKDLSKWFNGVDIFEKSFLVFPVCEENHWFAMIVCYPSHVNHIDNVSDSPDSTSQTKPKHVPAIIVMDSLGMNRRLVTRELRDFLDFEWRAKGTTVKSFSYHYLEQYNPPLPRQTNEFDCGIFMLAYLMAFMQNPVRFFRQVVKGEDKLPEKLSTSIHSCLSESSRESIKNLIPKICRMKNARTK